MKHIIDDQRTPNQSRLDRFAAIHRQHSPRKTTKMLQQRSRPTVEGAEFQRYLRSQQESARL